MKQAFLVLPLLSASLCMAMDRTERRINKIIAPYEQAINFVAELDQTRKVNDHDVFVFFNKHGLHQKKDIRKFYSGMRHVKRLVYSKKALQSNHRIKFDLLLYDVEQVKNFITDHLATYNAVATYYEIAASYYYVDEQHQSVVALLMQQSEKLGLPSMQGRGLYKFVKKIDVDLCRLTVLFNYYTVSDDLIVKMNHMKNKLVVLKNKIIVSLEYKSQLSKTRKLKAFGILFMPVCMAASLPFMIGNTSALAFTAVLYPTILESACVGAAMGIIIHRSREFKKCGIPVYNKWLNSSR